MRLRFPFPSGGRGVPSFEPPAVPEAALSRRQATLRLLEGIGLAAATTSLAACAMEPGAAPDTGIAASLGTTDVRWVDTLADLKNIHGSTSGAVIARSHSTNADGGGGVFCWCVGAATNNDATIVVPTSQPNPVGYWQRVYSGGVDIRWFGAKGDGSDTCPPSDPMYQAGGRDTCAIQKAIDFVSAAGGGTVLIPAGAYSVKSLVINAPYVKIEGVGKESVLWRIGSENAVFTVGAVGFVEVRDLTITTHPELTPSAGWAIYCAASSSWLTIENLYLYRLTHGIGLQPVLPSEVHNCVIRNVIINQVTQQGISLFNCIDTFISDSGIFNIGWAAGSCGLMFDSGSDGLYTSNLIVTQGATGIAIQNSNPDIANNKRPEHGMFSRTASDGGGSATSAAWRFSDGERIHLDECWAATQQKGASGISIARPCQFLEFNNCFVLNNNTHGYRISGGRDIGIIGGHILSNGQSTGPNRYGVWASATCGLRIVGARVGNDPAFAGAEQDVGIRLDAGCTNIVVQSCDLRGNTSKSIADGTGAIQKHIGANLTGRGGCA